MSQLSTLVVFLVMASPSPADGDGRAAVTVQAIEAKPGEGRTGEGIDPRLAEKLRVTLKVLGMKNPDLVSLGKTAKTLVKDGSLSVTASPYTVKVTCKEVGAESVTLVVRPYVRKKDPKTGRTVTRAMSPITTMLKKNQVLPVAPAQAEVAKKIFVVSAEEKE